MCVTKNAKYMPVYISVMIGLYHWTKTLADTSLYGLKDII